jgi:DEAD/DEAH box helicase domain-containing protein
MTLSLCIEECCDPADVAGMESSKHPDTMRPTLFLYDTVPGGIGITEKGFANFGKVFQRAYKILKECPFCSERPDSKGCPRCVTEQHAAKFSIDRKIGIEIAEMLNSPIDAELDPLDRPEK